MTDTVMNSRVDAFFDNAKSWQEEFRKLRTIALDCGLTEDLEMGTSPATPSRAATSS